MSSPSRDDTPDPYRTWRLYAVTVSGRSYELATKPGVFAHGRLDPAALLLATQMKTTAGDVVVHLNCGSGLAGAVASLGGDASRVLLTDRNVLSVEAARRTMAANGVRKAEVLLGHGAQPLPSDTTADVVAIRIPQERLALLQLIADAFRMLKIGGRCYLAGATNEGIKTATGTLDRLFGGAGVLARDSAHRVVVATKRAESPASAAELDSPWLEPEQFNRLDATLRGHQFALYTRPGVFSWDHVDDATSILAEAMQVGPGESVLDLGCGAGALGVVAGLLSGTGRTTMVDADSEAARSATRSAEANGLTNFTAITSDVAGAVLDQRFDVVVTNPPFHVGKATDLDVPAQFIRDAWTVLEPGGRMYLVANRTLPYERLVKQRFGNIATVHDGPRFKVLTATR